MATIYKSKIGNRYRIQRLSLRSGEKQYMVQKKDKGAIIDFFITFGPVAGLFLSPFLIMLFLFSMSRGKIRDYFPRWNYVNEIAGYFESLARAEEFINNQIAMDDKKYSKEKEMEDLARNKEVISKEII